MIEIPKPPGDRCALVFSGCALTQEQSDEVEHAVSHAYQTNSWPIILTNGVGSVSWVPLSDRPTVTNDPENCPAHGVPYLANLMGTYCAECESELEEQARCTCNHAKDQHSRGVGVCKRYDCDCGFYRAG